MFMGLEGSRILLSLLCFCIIHCHGIHHQPLSEEEEQELDKRLRILNKLPVKTVEISGDVIDCIDVYKQPAFDHPLLKDHKIQLNHHGPSSPRFNNRKLKNHTEGAGLFAFEGCPNGTIPIRRTTKHDLMREKSLWNLDLAKQSSGRSSHAGIDVEDTADVYWEGKATLNIWDPRCNVTQLSASIIRLASGKDNLPDENGVYAGWAVYPALYGDDRPHMFTYWKAKGSPGCYNLRCPGFVQTDSRYVLGAPFTKISEYGGVQQVVPVHIAQDQETKHWWLIWANDVRLGYWPKELFPSMANGANRLFFGGLVIGESTGPSPPMGSSYFPDNVDVKHSALMHGIEFSGLYRPIGQPMYDEPSKVLDSPGCYDVKDLGHVDNYGYFILFGGPGGPVC
ncbi:hypothetical protein MLD38_023371 [Melastoma candidum]|uniref:Uncharacterized protein n=1 Tax=Melastoma candidum TaxID=119954 RepID=A0ACB9QMA4_9MYRT|nr:hypothetical protein MLD38_023371 [Melastoma candidum]